MTLNIQKHAGVAIIAILAIALLISEIARFRTDRGYRDLSNELTETRQVADTALKAVIPAAILKEADKSVYMVLNHDEHYGTAFVIDRDRGVLATAAHVASELDFDAEEKAYSILNRHTGKPLRIRNAKIHSGSTRFRKLVETYQPVDPDSSIRTPRFFRIYDMAHDGALLFVDPFDPETGENLLGPNLPLGDEEKLLALSAGEPIASIGYPVDTLTANLTEESAASRIERGVISSMIAPIDLVERSKDPVANNLIVHRMAIAPGNSGGPLLDKDGDVVGINSHKSFSSFSNGDGVAQRVDVIYDLITPYLEEDRLEGVYLPEWTTRLNKWPKAEDVFPYALYYRHADIDDSEADAPEKLKDIEIADKKPFDVTIDRVEFSELTSRYVHFASDLVEAKEEEDEEEEDRNRIKQEAENRPSFLIEGFGQYYAYSFTLQKDRRYVFFAYDYAIDWETPGYCPLRLYHRRLGETELRSVRERHLTSIHIEPRSNPKARNIYEVIVQRPFCSAESKEFSIGVLSWKADSDATAADVPQTALRKAVPQAAIQFASSIENAFNCNGMSLGDPAECERSIKVRNTTPELYDE
ncbi:S1 family peptidase [Hyphococcus sp.]|uniref:S1 family peptidase n=1 Tax=Hyphococcus sp. TaxID=2038636 RepID=UPI003D0E6976